MLLSFRPTLVSTDAQELKQPLSELQNSVVLVCVVRLNLNCRKGTIQHVLFDGRKCDTVPRKHLISDVSPS